MDPRKPPADLADAILKATSGSTCGSARERLCDWVDGRLDPVDDGLVRQHAAACPDCRGLAGALRAMERDLPSLAEAEPGPAFTASVLEATWAPRPAPLAARLAAALGGMVQRPRFALEGAFIGTFLLALLFGTPNSPFAGVPQKALALATINPVEEIKEPAAGLETALTTEVRSAWTATSSRVSTTSRTVAGKIGGSFALVLDAFSPATATENATEPGASSSRLSHGEDTERDSSTDRSRDDRDRPDGDNQ